MAGVKPRLLDLFCGAGGCTKGYQRAGFEVVGVDIEPQPRYCGETFIQADALEFLDRLTESADDDRNDDLGIAGLDRLSLDQRRLSGVVSGGGGSVDGDRVIEAHGSSLVGDSDGYNRWAAGIKSFSAIHASPPCQAYSALSHHPQNRGNEYPDLVDRTRLLLERAGLPYVIENVVGAPLNNPTMLCGSSFGLPLKRHRLFETNFPVMGPPCAHGQLSKRFKVFRHGEIVDSSVVPVYGTGGGKAAEHWPEAMGIGWMSRDELTQAIPPAYTEHIGTYLMAAVKQGNPVRW